MIGTTEGHCKIFDPDEEKLLFEHKSASKVRFLIFLEKKGVPKLLVGEEETLSLVCLEKKKIEEELCFKGNFLETSELLIFQGVPYLLVTACDNLIHVYQVEEKMIFLNSLPGHANKVTALAVNSFGKNKEEVEFVSGSQDCFIRVWRIHKPEEVTIENKNIYILKENLIAELDSVL